MKRGYGRRLRIRAEQAEDALAHLVGCFVGESDGEDGGAWDAVRLNQVRNAMGDHPCFSASGARQKQERPVNVSHCLALLFVHACKEIHGEKRRERSQNSIAAGLHSRADEPRSPRSFIHWRFFRSWAIVIGRRQKAMAKGRDQKKEVKKPKKKK